MSTKPLPKDDISINDPRKQKRNFIIISVAVIGGISLAFLGNYYLGPREPQVKGSATRNEREEAIQRAYEVYAEYKAIGLNMEPGPCLTNDLMDNWVLDIAHDPRQEIDDHHEKQCKDYLLGKKDHFVELTPEGELIRAQ